VINPRASLKSLARECWAHDPDLRPPDLYILRSLETMLDRLCKGEEPPSAGLSWKDMAGNFEENLISGDAIEQDGYVMPDLLPCRRSCPDTPSFGMPLSQVSSPFSPTILAAGGGGALLRRQSSGGGCSDSGTSLPMLRRQASAGAVASASRSAELGLVTLAEKGRSKSAPRPGTLPSLSPLPTPGAALPPPPQSREPISLPPSPAPATLKPILTHYAHRPSQPSRVPTTAPPALSPPRRISIPQVTAVLAEHGAADVDGGKQPPIRPSMDAEVLRAT